MSLFNDSRKNLLSFLIHLPLNDGEIYYGLHWFAMTREYTRSKLIDEDIVIPDVDGSLRFCEAVKGWPARVGTEVRVIYSEEHASMLVIFKDNTSLMRFRSMYLPL